MQERLPRAPLEQREKPTIALQREHKPPSGALLSTTERTALLERLDSNPTKADWDLWNRDLEARIACP